MQPAPLRSIPPRLAVLYGAGVFVLVFALHYRLLRDGFWADDLGFLRAVPAFSFTDLPHLVDPYWGWFYRPVFLIAFAVMRRVFGENAVAYHAAGLMLHTLNIVLLGALVWRVGRRRWIAVLVGLVFLFHPLVYPRAGVHSESAIAAVAWISSGSTLLAAFFYLLTLHGWLSWRVNPRRWLYGATLSCFLLSLCSKEDALSLPFALLISDILLCPAVPWRRRLEYMLPFVLAGSGYLYLDAIAYIQYKSLVPQTGMLRTDDWLGRFTHALNFYQRLYLTAYAAGVPWLNLLCMAVLGWMACKTSRPLWAAWLWSLAVALPAPLASGSHAYGMRFFYLPALAAAMLIVAAGVGWWSHRDEMERTLGAVWIAALSASWLTIPVNDPFAILAWLGGFGVVAIMCYRCGWLGRYPTLLVVLTIVSAQLDIYGPTVPPGFWRIAEVALMLVFLRQVEKRRDWRLWTAVPAVLLLWPLTVSGYCVLLLLLLWPVIEKAVRLRALFDRCRPQSGTV